MADIIEHEQGLSHGRRYELFEFDLTEFELGFIRVFEGDENGDNAVSFDGNVYSPYPIQTDGWAITSQGRLPRPKFAVTNTTGVFTPMIENNNGLGGAPVKRTITYGRFLDDGADADPTQHDPIERYEINKVMSLGKINGVEAVQWELRTPPDRPNVKIGRIQVIKGPCQFSYRTFDQGTGQFVNGTCPYRGSIVLDEDNNATNNAGDECSQTSEGCELRHGVGNKLPYMAFVSVGELRR